MNNKKLRNRLITMLLLVMALLIPQWAWAQTASQPSVGDGSTDYPYIITKAEELAWFRDQVNGGNNYICAKISDDVKVIDMSTVCHAADKSQNLEELSWVPIGNSNKQYAGTFDGNGKTITNLYINASQNYMGLFGYTYKGTIKNLTFENTNVTNTGYYTGILVGEADGSTFQNIKISKTCQMKGGRDYTGGIAGSHDGNAYNCVNYASVQGTIDVGGLFGMYDKEGNSITACANYGNVTASREIVGGLVGYFGSGTILDCANYGDVKGTKHVAGMAGFVDKGKIKNVFSYGSISATKDTPNVGMAFGYSDKGTTEGMVAYYSGAKLTVNGQEQTVKAFGYSKLSEDNATGFTEAQLKSGFVAYQLQQNASSEAKWGQNMANDGDIYPIIGSEHTVYADNLTLNCKTYEVVTTGSFTNNPTSSTIKYQHGQISYHAATNATCTEAATKEYWQCQDCQRIYSDSRLTEELTDVTNAEKPALGHSYNEDGYCDRCKHYVVVKPSEENGVYLIAKPYHLAWFRDYVNGTIVDEGEEPGTTHPSASAMLTADIDLKNYCHAAEDGKELLSWLPIGNDNNPIGNDNNRWKGNMDGHGHIISNLYIKTAQNCVGLFGYTEDATIQDLIFDNAKVENVSTTNTTDYTGILAGYAFAYTNSPAHIKGIKTTKNCTIIGQKYTGGIVGYAKINLENCENHSSVKGTRIVGGIAGYSCKNIKRCTNYGTVENDDMYIGGIIGYTYETSIKDCANYGKITSTGGNAGGIAGLLMGNSSIQNVFSYGDMTYTDNYSGIIIGPMNGTLTAKGIVAYNKEALLNNSSENIKIAGAGNLTFEDGKKEADVVKAFTKQQIKSGEVAWLLNGSTSAPTEGSTLAWYQNLGEDGDEYPVLTPSNGNTVYNNYYTCVDKQVHNFSNTEADAQYDKHDKGTETLLANGLYSSTCQRCQTNFMYIKDFCGIDGNDLELTANADGNYKAKAVTLTDKAAYNSPVDFEVSDFTYTRNNPHTEWQVYYVPFDIDCDELANAGITANYINNFHEYTKNGETEVVLEVKEVTSGTLKANVPYVIKAAQSGETQIHTNNVTLHRAESKTLNCQSVTHDYSFKGIYKAQSGFNQDENINNGIIDYTLKGGKFLELTQTATLSPMRWYLTICNRNKATETPSAHVSRVKIKVVGEGEATGIEEIYVITDGDVSVKQGIYDLQGRRLSAEPAHGVYIKNGKKIIK